jgi:hypothetical protein
VDEKEAGGMFYMSDTGLYFKVIFVGMNASSCMLFYECRDSGLK